MTPYDEPTPETPTDAELVARSLEDPRAFMPLVDRHRRVLFGYLARRVGRDDAEELTSETFTRAFAQRHRYDTARADARPWLFGIAVNLMRNQRRGEVRQLRAYRRHGVHDVHHDDVGEMAARLDAGARSAELASALTALAPRDREVLLLFAWGDQSYEDIAAALNVPVGTVRSRLNRARRVVRDHLALDAGQPDDVAIPSRRSGDR